MKLKNVSASQVSAFNRCQRFWFYGWIKRIRTPQTDAQKRGTDIHREIEHYLKHGVVRKSKWAPYVKAAAAMLKSADVQPNHDDLIIEQGFLMPTATGLPPWKGFIDIGWSGSEILKVLDTKTTSNFRYAKTPAELADDIQLNSYGQWVFNEAGYPGDVIEIGHGYIHSRLPKTKLPNTKLVTIKRDRSQVAEVWERDVQTVREMVEVAKEKDPQEVKPTTSACSMYGGCPHLSRCGAQTSFSNYFSQNKKTNQEGVIPMSTLLDKLKKARGAETDDAPKKTTKKKTTKKKAAPKKEKKTGLAAKAKANKAKQTKTDPGDDVLPPDAPERTTEVKEEDDAPKEETKKTKKKTTRKKTTAKKNGNNGTIVFINCAPTKGWNGAVRYEDWFGPLLAQMNEVASQSNNVAGYWSLGFAEQKDFIAKAVDAYVEENGLPDQLIITDGMPLAKEVLFSIGPHASMIVQRN